jgi:hypothetical protein
MSTRQTQCPDLLSPPLAPAQGASHLALLVCTVILNLAAEGGADVGTVDGLHTSNALAHQLADVT